MANDAFSKLKSSVNRGITTISVKTSSFTEKSKIKTHIDSINKEIEARLLNAGNAAFKIWEQGGEDYTQLNDQFVFIKQKYAEIEELNAQLMAIDERDNQILGNNIEEIRTDGASKYFCTQCGAQYDEQLNFCRKCGSNQIVDNSPKAFCTQCGAQYDEPVKFCRNCGNKMGE